MILLRLLLDVSYPFHDKDYLKYILPIDTDLTKEWGDIELYLTFTMLDTDSDVNIVQRVRKTDKYYLNITQIPDWDSLVPDSALSALDQRILKQDAQIKALAELADAFEGNIDIVDNLVYDDINSTLQLSANGVGVGDKVSVKDMLDEGAPVVDFNSNQTEKPNEDDNSMESNVVEF